MKNILLLVVVLGISLSSAAQQRWDTVVRLTKNFTQSGYVFSFVRKMDNNNPTGALSMYGYFDKVYTKNTNGQFVLVCSDSNTTKKVGSTWQTAGRISFAHSHSAIFDHVRVNNDEYIGVELGDTIVTKHSAIFKLDPVQNRYMPITAVKFDAGIFCLIPLTGNNIFVSGGAYSAIDATGVDQVIEGGAIWNTATNIITPQPIIGIYGEHSVSKNDSTAMILNSSGYRFHVLYYNSTAFQDALYPPVPTGGRFMTAHVIDKNNIYVYWQKDSLGRPGYLMRLNGNAWEHIPGGRFTNPTGTEPSDNEIIAIRELNGKIIFSGTFRLRENQTTNHILSYDPVANTFTELPKNPHPGTDYRLSRIEVVNDKLYLIDNSSLIFQQLIYELVEGPLPVTLSSFTAQQQGSGALLRWSTATESNTSHFDIQRSTNGSEFNVVGKVAAAGNTSTVQHYQSSAPLTEGRNYYRLNMIDRDGKQQYSPIRLITSKGNSSLVVYENPVRSTLRADIGSTMRQKVTVRLLNVTGATVLSKELTLQQGTTPLSLNVSALPKGMYVLSILMDTEVQSVPIVIQ